MSQLTEYKAGQARRRGRERNEGLRKMDRAAAKTGIVVGLAAAPHTTSGIKLGPIPLSAVLGVPAVIIDIAFAPKHPLAVFVLGLLEGLAMADIPAASARMRP